MKIKFLSLMALMVATSALAGDITRVFVSGTGSVRIERVRSFDAATPLAAAEVVRLPFDYSAPAQEKYLKWDGSKLIELSLAEKQLVDAAEAQAAQDAIDQAAAASQAAFDAAYAAYEAEHPREPDYKAIVHGVVDALKSSGGDVTKLDAEAVVATVEVKSSEMIADAKAIKEASEPVTGTGAVSEPSK